MSGDISSWGACVRQKRKPYFFIPHKNKGLRIIIKITLQPLEIK